MDFGTTNSGMAVYDGQAVKVLPLDPANKNPHVARTALYVTNDQRITFGREAVNGYFDENIGRPVKMKRVWVGEVEVYGADMFYITDVYAWVDALSPGRLFLSIKSGLRDPEYQGTVIGQFYYSLENLIAIYMNLVKLRAQRLLGQEVKEVVLGRPVHFSTDPQADELAQQRLLDSAFRAGFERVYLQYEPIAAAYHYATGIDNPQNILVFDFGGGTLDITVMHLDGRSGREVLATGGIPIAGDIFDQRVVRAKFPKHFGEGTHYGAAGRRLPMPKWIYDVFSDWQKVFELQTLESRNLLREIAQTSDDRSSIDALIGLVSNNYSLQMFDLVETAKRRLSTDMATVIHFKGTDFRISEIVSRSEFEKIIRPEILTIEHHLNQTLADSGLQASEIDAVIRTGGSSTIPIFRHMLVEKFGREKVLDSDTFSSVTSGLGIIAHGISTGEIKAEAFTPGDIGATGQKPKRQKVTPVNLSLLKRRLAAQESQDPSDSPNQPEFLLRLLADGRLLFSSIERQQLKQRSTIPLVTNWNSESPLQAACWASRDEPILLVSSVYRFFVTSVGNLLALEDMGLDMAGFLQLRTDEHITAIKRWLSIKENSCLMFVSSLGYARSYKMNGLVKVIEGPTPHQFDQPLPGLPLAVFGAEPTDNFVIIMDSGRAVRYCLEDLPLLGLQAINRRQGEQISGVGLIQGEIDMILVTENGYGRRLPAESVPIPAKPNSHGRVMVARRPVAGLALLGANETVWALSNHQLWALSEEKIPAGLMDSTRTRRLFKLADGERIMTLLPQ